MRVFFPDEPDLPLPPGHRFPGGKYRMLREAVVREGIIPADRLAPSPPAALPALLGAHSPEYVAAVIEGRLGRDAERRIGLPWSEALVRRSRATVGGSLAASRLALADGLSGQLAGGTHHAHAGFGSGFCVFNDLAVTVLTLLDEGAVRRVAIIDLDVHQGDGTAAILGTRDDVFILDVHGANNFPFRKVPAHLDVALPDGTGDAQYLAALEPALTRVTAFAPDLVLYLAGVDPLVGDTLGRLALTFDGLMARDRMVLEGCRDRALPVAIVAGGGYSDPIARTVAAYANTWRTARAVFG